MNAAHAPSASASEWQQLREVELLLFREAELADANRYDEWFRLWTDELLYWVPCNSDDLDPARSVSLIYDDRARLEERLFRLGTKHAHSQRPQSRLTRLVSNGVFDGYDPDRGGAVTSRFVAAEVRHDRQTVWSGRMRHVLARVDGGLRIREKHVFLVNNDSPMNNLTFII
jgi:3-phenylpropionate/cinnamic acid dioxygenase small subunit